MLHNRIFTVSLEIKNPIGFCNDKIGNALVMLRDLYERKCYQGSFIIQITGVTKCSNCVLTTSNNSAGGIIQVQFSAIVAVFAVDDILTGIKILKMDQQMIIGSSVAKEDGKEIEDVRSATAVVNVSSSNIKNLREEQIVGVRITALSCGPFKAQVAIVGKLLTCDTSFTAFKVKGELTKTDVDSLAPIFKTIETELARRKKLYETRKADLFYFEMLLYSFAGVSSSPEVKIDFDGFQQKNLVWHGPASKKSKHAGVFINIFEIVNKAKKASVSVDEVWGRPLHIYRSSPLFMRLDDSSSEGGLADITFSPAAVVSAFLVDISNFLFATRSMSEIYATKELKDSHNNIWAIMRDAQLK